MARLAAPPAVDLAQLAKGGVWHHVESVEHVPARDGALSLGGGGMTAGSPARDVVTTVCGTKRDAVKVERDVDAKAVRHLNVDVCAHCRAGGSTLNPKNDNDQGDEPGEEPAVAASTEKKTTARKPAAKKPAAAKPARAAKVEPKAATLPEIKTAISKADRAIANQPKRAERELTAAENEKQHKLGKAIAADRWLLKKAQPGKTSSATVAAMVERIEARVAQRNEIRRAAK